MDKAKISWYVQDINKDYIENNTYYAGSYTKDTALVVPIRIWNNRYGTTAVQDVKNLRLALYFDNIEDNALLPYLSVATGLAKGTSSIAGRVMTVTFVDTVTISGKANDGTDKNATDNYIDLTVTLDVTNENARLKAHDLKNLYIEIAE